MTEIASRMLGRALEGKKLTFFNFRHTGATHIAQRGKTPAHLLAVVKMMGDTNVATVNRTNIEPEFMQELVLGWKRPDVHIPSLASADLFGAEQTPIFSTPLARAASSRALRTRITTPCNNRPTTAPLAPMLRAHF